MGAMEAGQRHYNKDAEFHSPALATGRSRAEATYMEARLQVHRLEVPSQSPNQS